MGVGQSHDNGITIDRGIWPTVHTYPVAPLTLCRGRIDSPTTKVITPCQSSCDGAHWVVDPGPEEVDVIDNAGAYSHS